MKPKNIIRDVQKLKSTRELGTSPGIGRVAKTSQSSSPRTPRPSASPATAEPEKKSILLLASFLIFMLVASFAAWRFLNAKPVSPTAHPPVLATSTAPEHSQKLVASLSEPEITRQVQKALTAKTPEEMAEYFRLGTTEPAHALEILRQLAIRDGESKKITWIGSVPSREFQEDHLFVAFQKDTKVRIRCAICTPDASGKWKIDFDAFACTVSPPWPEIIEKESITAQVRAFVAPDHYFNGHYSDESQWSCYSMASSDLEGFLHAYCKIGSPQDLAMKRLFTNQKKLNRVFLEIRKTPDVHKRQFEITRVLAPDWIMGNTPFDEGF